MAVLEAELPGIAAIKQRIEDMLEICPRCGTRQQLCDVLIRKKSQGGKSGQKSNMARLCAPCNADYLNFSKGKRLGRKSKDERFLEAFKAFLQTEVEESSTRPRIMDQLRACVTMRISWHLQKQSVAGRFRSLSRVLDKVLPIAMSVFARKKLANWQELFKDAMAGNEAVQAGVERQILKLLEGTAL